MTNKRYDVAILGGGLAGTAMALSLARHGLSVALVDPAPVEVRADLAFDGRAYAIAPGSRNLLGALEIWDVVEAEAQVISRIRVDDRTPGPAPAPGLVFDPAEAGQAECGWIVEDRFLRRALLSALSTSDVTHLAPERATHVARDSVVAAVSLESGVELTASLVVACDGRRSATARAAGIQYLSWSYGQTGLVSAISHELPHAGVAYQSFFAGGPFAVLPLPGQRSALVWSEREERARSIAALDDQRYMDEVRLRLGPRLGQIELAGRRWAYPLGLALAARIAVSRLVVAGDAAHGVHPIAGQGLNMGLRDVAALTQVLVEAARLGLDVGAANVVEDYQRWRRFDATAMSLGMDGLNRLFSTDNPPLQALRNAGLGLVGQLPDARRFFLEAAAGRLGDVPRLLRGQPV